MNVVKSASAGTMESGDIFVEIEKSSGSGVEIELQSTVASLYGRQIKKVIEEAVAERGVSGVKVTATDKGALDCTIKARVSTALLRACESSDYGWAKK